MKNFNFVPKARIVLVIAAAGMLSAGNLAADIVVDPKGHDAVQMEQDIRECRELVNSIDFNLAKEHQGRAVARGAVAAGGFAAIAGGGKEARRRSAAAGAMAGGLVRNKAKRVDNSAQEVKVKEAQRNCLLGRGYVPLS
jgi:uncharacterized protein YcfJ